MRLTNEQIDEWIAGMGDASPDCTFCYAKSFLMQIAAQAKSNVSAAGGAEADMPNMTPEIIRSLIHDAYQCGVDGVGYTSVINKLYDVPSVAGMPDEPEQPRFFRYCMDGEDYEVITLQDFTKYRDAFRAYAIRKRDEPR